MCKYFKAIVAVEEIEVDLVPNGEVPPEKLPKYRAIKPISRKSAMKN